MAKPHDPQQRRALQLQNQYRTWPEITDFPAFYAQLFAPVSAALGPFDRSELTPPVGFAHGGPVNIATIGRDRRAPFVTYVTCELACYCAQRPCPVGQFEILTTANDQAWAQAVLSALGRLSFEDELDQGHSVNVGRIAGPASSLQAVIFERFSTTRIGNRHFSILRAIGITRAEMEFCLRFSPIALVKRMKQAGYYPLSDARRPSVPL
ncbi:MAG TPA: suppressor of fused domain protein [Myxococcales bacterium]|nr:suppressor of fused domain protein [Myxococcales bacterium]